MSASDHLGIQFEVDPKDRVVYAHDPAQPLGPIGHLSWNKTSEGAKVSDVFVSRDYRHQGVATSMYQHATRANGRPLSHSAYRTDDGEGWARTVGGAMPPRREAGRE